MSICRARLRNTSNALTFQMPANRYVFKSNRDCSESTAGWTQMTRQWIPDGWSGDRKCTGPKSVVNSWNWQLMTSGRSQMLATRHFGDWHTVVSEVPWSSVLKTTMDCHSKLVLHSLGNNQPVQVVMHRRRQTALIFPGPCDQTWCCILKILQLVHNLCYTVLLIRTLILLPSGNNIVTSLFNWPKQVHYIPTEKINASICEFWKSTSENFDQLRHISKWTDSENVQCLDWLLLRQCLDWQLLACRGILLLHLSVTLTVC